MRVSCVLAAEEVGEDPSDLIVFPEGACRVEIQNTCSKFPDSIVVGTEADGEYCRGLLIHHHQNKIDYLKIGTDGRTSCGSEQLLANPRLQNPVYEINNICIGVLICMDVNDGDFMHVVINRIRSSRCQWKVLCIPADMGAEWLCGDLLPQWFQDIHVVLCNNTTYQSRCQSFMTALSGKKLTVQHQHDPIHIQLPSA